MTNEVESSFGVCGSLSLTLALCLVLRNPQSSFMPGPSDADISLTRDTLRHPVQHPELLLDSVYGAILL